MFDWRGFTNLCCHLFPEMFTACVPCFSEQTKAGLTYQRTPTPLNRRGSDLVEPESCSSAPELACRGERRAWRQTTSRVAAAAAGRMTSSGFHHGDRCDFDIARPRSHKNVMMQGRRNQDGTAPILSLPYLRFARASSAPNSSGEPCGELGAVARSGAGLYTPRRCAHAAGSE